MSYVGDNIEANNEQNADYWSFQMPREKGITAYSQSCTLNIANTKHKAKVTEPTKECIGQSHL